MAALATAPVAEDMWRRHARIIRRALVLAGFTEKSAIAQMRIAQAQWSRQLAGVGSEHLSLRRLAALDERFWQAYAVLLVEEFGVPAFVERAAHLTRVTKARNMAKMALPQAAAKESA